MVHNIQRRDKRGLKSFPSFIFAPFWFYLEVKYSILIYVERKRQTAQRQRGEKNERRHL